MSPAEPPRRRSRWGVVLAASLASVFAAALVIGGLFGLQALEVRSQLESAKASLGTLAEAAQGGDEAELQRIAADVQSQVFAVNETVNTPLWGIAASVPLVGINIEAVQRAAQATDVLVRDVLPVAVEILAATDLDNLRLEGGGIDLEPFRLVETALPEISSSLVAAKAITDEIRVDELLPPVGDAVSQLVEVIDQAAPALDLLDRYLPTLLELMGDSEARRYLVLFQNNAESRATGGSAAASVLLQIDGGKVDLLEQASSDTYYAEGLAGQAFVDVPEGMRDLYEWDFALYSQNYTRTPNFPMTAEMFRTLNLAATGEDIDGVISIDPVVLSHMLEASGPVVLDTGEELTAENAVQLLLSDTYERYGGNGVAADAFFASVAARVFETMVSGSWDPALMLDQLGRSADEQRINLWFARESEEALATDLGVSGALSTDNEGGTEVGIFVNNAGYSKLDYYLTSEISVTCNAEAATMTTTIQLTNRVPSSDLSDWTLAQRNPSLGIPRTSMLQDVVFVAPPHSRIESRSPGTGDLPWDRVGSESGREAESITIVLPMGESRTVSFTNTIPDDARLPISVRHSPGVGETPITVDASCEASI